MDITRNGVTLTPTPVKIKRGEKKDQTYLAIEITKENLEKVITFLGVDTVVEILRAKLNLWFQSWTEDATENGELDVTKYTEFVTSLSARGESIPDLQEKLFALLDEMSETSDAAKQSDILSKVLSIKSTIESKKRGKGKDATAPAPAAA